MCVSQASNKVHSAELVELSVERALEDIERRRIHQTSSAFTSLKMAGSLRASFILAAGTRFLRGHAAYKEKTIADMCHDACCK